MSEVKLFSQCPVQSPDCFPGCFYWKHSKDNGEMWVSCDGYLRCDKCFTKGNIIDWLFDCGNHGYLKASAQGLCLAMVVLLQTKNVSKEWLFKVQKEIWKQEGYA